jgi:hypothetical protein
MLKYIMKSLEIFWFLILKQIKMKVTMKSINPKKIVPIKNKKFRMIKVKVNKKIKVKINKMIKIKKRLKIKINIS